VPLYALKVLDGQGIGSLSEMLNAVKWVATEGYKLGIGVINLSLAVHIDPSVPLFNVTYAGVCSFFKEVNDIGVVALAASANSGVNIQGFFPASCQETVTVTALDAVGRAPGPYSNWMPSPALTSNTAAVIKSPDLVIAAPGTMIRSTMTCGRVESGYMNMSGTSMATPHVAAVVANCIMSGSCASGVGGVGKFRQVQQASKERRLNMSTKPFFGFSGDAVASMNGRFYGYLVWGDKF
jgi:subtilisin family serine protease